MKHCAWPLTEFFELEENKQKRQSYHAEEAEALEKYR
jgi:hypothetical protein